MKVLFADIDGVLNCRKTHNPRKFPYIVDPLLLERFERVIEATQAKVVLSSTWRYDPAGLFSAKHWGIPFKDVLPDMPGRPRRDEILSWLSANQTATRYAVLDDEDDELDDLPLFQPNDREGLSDEICAGLIAYLNGRTERDMRRSRVVRIAQNLMAFFRGHRG
jgi:hypothetical protein